MNLIPYKERKTVNNNQGFNNGDINFNNVSNDVKGCGFRHEEFPNIIIDDEDRIKYMANNKQKDYLRNMLFDIPENISGRNLEAYMRGIISLKIEAQSNNDIWWENAYRKYNLPWGIKYNPQQNKFYRHITEDNRVSTLDRNPNYKPNNNPGNQQVFNFGNGQDNRNFNQDQSQQNNQFGQQQGNQYGNQN
jgi:hypothetical protein